MACALGYLGLIPFVVPTLLIWFVAGDVANMLETMQFAYAGLIISFMGGVQWGYAVKQTDAARSWQFILSVMPTLVIFAVLSLVLILKLIHITGIMIGLLIFQAVMDHRTVTEKWFLKLRWILTVTASVSMVVVALKQGFY